MNHPVFKSILNTALPHGFRYVRLERARDRSHPECDSNIAHIMIAPFDMESRIATELYRKHREACRVVKRRPNSEDCLGHLLHGAGGSWRFHYDLTGNALDDVGSHFDDERFELGECVSLQETDGLNVYRVVSVMPL
jgi:hypothetical protein